MKLECELKTQKKSMKRKFKKEKKKIYKEFSKKAEELNPGQNDGTFLQKVKEKYGDDVMIKKQDKEDPLLGKRMIEEE